MKFRKPPVEEVVIGVQFDEGSFTNEYAFEFFQEIKSSFPTVLEKERLPNIFEKLEGKNEIEGINNDNWSSRKLFVSEDGSKLIQLQSTKMLFNWRKADEEKEYPHFDNVFKEFKQVFDQFNKGVSIQDNINQLEVTYVDHVYLDDFGKNDYDPGAVFDVFNFGSDLKIKSFQNQTSFPIETLNGNITLSVRSAVRNEDNRKLLRLETTCRGSPNDHPFDKWFEIAHDELLQFFDDIISDKAKNVWGLEN